MADLEAADVDPEGIDTEVSAYMWSVALAKTLLDSPHDLRLWSGRRQDGAKLRLIQRCLTFEDVPDLVEEILSLIHI